MKDQRSPKMWVIQPRSHGGSEVGLVILGADLSLVRLHWILIYTFSLLPVLLPSNCPPSWSLSMLPFPTVQLQLVLLWPTSLFRCLHYPTEPERVMLCPVQDLCTYYSLRAGHCPLSSHNLAMSAPPAAPSGLGSPPLPLSLLVSVP